MRFSKALAAGLLLVFTARAQNYLGFDRNEYPGDAAMTSLRKSFAYTGYWLNTPPGAKQNSWAGKRTLLRGLGYGFLVLFNGRVEAQLVNPGASLGASSFGAEDGKLAIASAEREGFVPGTLIFLDQEEGGRLTPEQAGYIDGWRQTVERSVYKPGVYASGIDVPDGPGRTISTVRDLHMRFPELHLWVANDQCPPAPGCTATKLSPSASGSAGAEVWQYAQSPRREQFAAQCRATYAADGNCYSPPSSGDQSQSGAFLDLNTASSPDPSRGR